MTAADGNPRDIGIDPYGVDEGSTSKKDDGFFDHHKEVMQAKMALEDEDRQKKIHEALDSNRSGDNPQDFDDIEKSLHA